MSTKSGGKLFYGWVIVFAGMLITGATIGTFNNTLSVFVKPVTEDLGFARGQFTIYNSIMGFSGILMMPLYGEMFRRGKNKLVMLVCSCLVCGAAVGYSFSGQLWHFYLFAAIGGGAVQGTSNVAISTIVNNWFHEKKGLATGLALSGTGLFGAVLVPIVTRVIESFGWRWGYRTLSIVGIVFLIPCILLLIRVKPADMGLVPYGSKPEVKVGDEEELVGFTRAEAFKMPSFYLVTGGIVVAILAGTAMQAHAMSYLTDIGYVSVFASRIVSISMVALIFGKIGMGWVFDRFGVMIGCITASLSFFLALSCLLVASVPVAPYIYAVMLGYGLALGSVASPLITVRYFGSRDFSRIFAITGVAGAGGSALGQPLCGFVFDITGSYIPAWYMGIGFAVISAVMFVLAETFNRRAWDKLIAAEAARDVAGSADVTPAATEVAGGSTES